jgi:hypothetical protein
LFFPSDIELARRRLPKPHLMTFIAAAQRALPAALSRAATPPGDEIVQAPVIARRRSDRCEGPALLRSQHDADKLVETYERAADAFLNGSIKTAWRSLTDEGRH